MPKNNVDLCPCCLLFYDRLTGEQVDMDYWEMPAELALEIMIQRNGVLYCHPKTKHNAKRWKKR